MKLISENIVYGPQPQAEDEVEQHLTICQDGRVYLSRYTYGTNSKHNLFSKEQFKISPSKANYILSLLGMYFEDNIQDYLVCDVGTWGLELENEKGEIFHFVGSLCDDLQCRYEYISKVIREFTNKMGLYCFDGDARNAIEVKQGEYIFVDVLFDDNEKKYCYISEDIYIEVGDEAVVPFGVNNTIREGLVVQVQVVTKENAPYPIEKCKRMLRRL